MRMPLEGGEAKQIYPDTAQLPSFAPDGKTVALGALEGKGVDTRLVIKLIDVNGGPPTRSFGVDQFISGPLTFSADGQSLYYPITQHGVSNLVRQSVNGGDPVPVTNFNDLQIYDYSYDWANKKLAVTRGHSSSDAVLIKDQRTE